MKLLKVDTIESVRNKMEQYFHQVEKQIEMVDISKAAGRYIAEELSADTAMPQFRRSVVDGYAVMAKETYGVSDGIPGFFNVTGAVEMGRIYEGAVGAGQAVYVPTGGMIPEGADAVVMIEYTERLDEGTIGVNKPAAPNNGIMNIGDDFQAGEIFFKKGHRLSRKDIGMLAICGRSAVQVYRQPVISVLSTGDELIEITKVPKPGQVRDINGHTLCAFAEEAGGVIGSLKLIQDDFDACRDFLQEQMESSDLVMISGGSSAGDKDMTAEIIGTLGMPGVFTHGIAIKPGKPTIIGSAQGKPVFGLPGHPLSAVIVFKAVVEPFIKKYYFGNEEISPGISAVVTENIHAGEGRETYQMVTLEKLDGIYRAVPIRAKSGAISQLMKADGYIKIDGLTEGINEGDWVEIILL